jgi:predicted membrane protein
MSNFSNKRNYSLAFLLIFLGTFSLIDQLGYGDFGYLISVFWPFILVFVGLRLIIRSKIIGGTLLASTGIIFFLQNLNLLPIGAFKILWPLIFIFLGIFVLFKPQKSLNSTASRERKSINTWTDIEILFGGIDSIISKEGFENGSVNANFSTVRLDLSECDIQEKAELNINLAFSSLELKVPTNWRIVSQISPVAGSFKDGRRINGDKSETKELVIKGDVVFSSVKIG